MFIKNLAYEASAGSGKTFMLVVRYLSLLFQGADPSKILALTFTNKAASEMSQRVVETLEELELRGELQEIIKVTQLSKEELLQRRAEVLEEFLNAHTKIMTIDSFFTQILRKFSLYASLMPDFTTFASQHELKLMSTFLRLTRQSKKQERLISLALESNRRFSNIFALLNELYEKGVELQSFSFSSTDAEQYKGEIITAFRELETLVVGCKDASKTVLSALQADSFDEMIAKKWIGRDTLQYRTFSKCFKPEMDDCLLSIQKNLKLYNRAKEQNFFSALFELRDLYKQSKKTLYINESELSFSDVTALVYEILHLLDDSEFLYFRLDAKIEHILLDEFQDTSILQYEILRPLIKEITSGSGVFENGSFFFVGDVKQSIYRFRGGVSALFSEVVKDNDTTLDKLKINYRSQKVLVNYVNDIFQKKITHYTPQEVRKGAHGGFVEVCESQEPIQEAIKRVQELISLGADKNEIAILCATNGDGESMKLALQEENIEVVTETTTKLINQQSVQAIIEYFKYLRFEKEIYRYNFFALIEREVEVLELVELHNYSLVDLAKNIINHYGLFDQEFHLLRFIEVLKNFQDIESFLFEYEQIDSSAAASDLSGVRVLTVHKSKGLEYDHVIVLDRLKRKPASRAAIIYEYEGIKLENIYLRTKGRENIDDQYAKAIEKEKILEQEDAINGFYVAFTRAKENLFIIKKPKDSSFDILSLVEEKRGELKVKKLETPKQETKKTLEYQSLYYGLQSDLLHQEQEEDENFDALNFGIALHYMLEMLGDFELSMIPQAYTAMINKYGALLCEQQRKDIVNRVENLLKQSEFLELIDGECFKEKGLKFQEELRYIDLLVQHSDGVWIVIDYKSSTQYQEKHKAQVRSYIKAIEDITKSTVKGYLCYLLSDTIELLRV
jgi:exodeoxyribonuclease V beta subunit